WNPGTSNNQTGQVTARMETTPSLGSASISVSQQQTPKKFAPAVAPKPKFNPYKQTGDPANCDPAESLMGVTRRIYRKSTNVFVIFPMVKGPEKTLEERRASLDAEIDSLTSILADLEGSSPYKPRSTQSQLSTINRPPCSPSPPLSSFRLPIPLQTVNFESAKGGLLCAFTSPMKLKWTLPLIHKIPNVDMLHAKTKASLSSPTPQNSGSAQPTFNVQVRSAQPGPQHQVLGGHGYGQQPIRSPSQVQYMPAQPRGPDFAYGPPQPGFSPMSHGGYQEHHQPGIPQGGGMSSRRPEPLPAQQYQPPGPKKTYITDVPPSLAPYNSGPTMPPKVRTLFLNFELMTNLPLSAQ
ncbi:unnamed protein product, partial [Tetraodon nigroviridis]